MAECILLKGGGTNDLDQVTATASDILIGKVGVNSDGDAIMGTMRNRGSMSYNLNADSSYTIPQGYHDGTGIIKANGLASQTVGNAVASQIVSGMTAWVNGVKVTGTLESQSGSTTIPGTSDKTVVSAIKRVTGDIIVKGDSNLIASNIKKGTSIFGVTGTFEGYVAGTDSIWRLGSYGSDIRFIEYYSNSGFWVTTTGNILQMYRNNGTGGFGLRTNSVINFSKYNKIRLVRSSTSSSTNALAIRIMQNTTNSTVNNATYLGYSITNFNSLGTLDIDVSSINTSGYLVFTCGTSAVADNSHWDFSEISLIT